MYIAVFVLLAAASAANVPCGTVSTACRANATCYAVLDRFHVACDAVINGQSSSCPVDGECYRNYTLLVYADPIGKDFVNCSCGSNLTCQYRHDNVSQACGVSPTPVSKTSPTPTSLVASTAPAALSCLDAQIQCNADSTCKAALANFLDPNGPCKDILSYSSGVEPTCTSECRNIEQTLSNDPAAKRIGLQTCDCGSLGALCSKPRENYDRFCTTSSTKKPSGEPVTQKSTEKPATEKSTEKPTSGALALKATVFWIVVAFCLVRFY